MSKQPRFWWGGHVIGYQTSLIPGEDERSEKRLQMERDFETVLKQGPVIEGGKIRIAAAFACTPGTYDRIEFVRDEYGTGGFANGSAWADFGYTGITVKRPGPECQYSWGQVVSKINQLITRGEYLSEREQAEMDRIFREYRGIPCPIARHKYPH